MRYKLGFIGAGNMAEAIVRAAVGTGVLKADKIVVADPTEARRAVFEKMGVAATGDNGKVAGESEQVVLAVKPQALGKVAGEVAGNVSGEQVVVSIMAGLGSGKIAQALREAGATGELRIVRVMPNTPVLVGCGMAAVARGEGAKPGDEELAMRLFEAGGKAVRVEEGQMDAITAVSGSGPAYVFYLAEAMEQAASELGLGEHGAELVAQTVLGAARLLSESDNSAAELRKKVMSPGGTTEAAIQAMEERGVKASVVEGVKAAERKSRELGA